MRRRLKIGFAAGGFFLGVLAVVALPILYVEVACRGTSAAERYEPIISDPEWQRPEARTFLTYPEWHMVYAYEDFARVLESGDEYDFDYGAAVRSFWSSYCTLNRHADARGGADLATRQMIYTIGTSFNAELGLKALYEKTVGRAFAALRGSKKTPQDRLAAAMAREYGAFLHQVPWYRFPFSDWTDRLWAEPTDGSARARERRLALGAEWSAKQAYANLIAQAVSATGADELRIRSVVADLTADRLSALPGVDIISSDGARSIIETDRYAAFTRILRDIASAGGRVVEIAGNDDIMISVLRRGDDWNGPGKLIESFAKGRDGRPRALVLVKVDQLADVIRGAGEAYEIEHVFDY